MDKLLSSIATRIKYIRSNSDNAFINSALDIVEIKIEELKERKYSSVAEVEDICNHIISYDIRRMKGGPGETNMVYKKMDELAGFVEELKVAYFEAN